MRHDEYYGGRQMVWRCSRPTKSGNACKGNKVVWFPEISDPNSCISHLTKEERAELKEIHARSAALWSPAWERDAIMVSGDPACWSWPIPTDEQRTAVQQKFAKYRIDQDGLDSLFMHEWHEGRCAICSATGVHLVQDHDHKTGLERGNLCRSCNTREGMNRGSGHVFDRYRQKNPASILGVQVRYWDPFTNEYAEPAQPPGDPWLDNPMRNIGL